MIAEEPAFRALLRRGWDPVIVADRLALGLARARHRLTLALASAARRFIEERHWLSFGYARLEDHARERFGRSGRWLRDLHALDDAITLSPDLGRALTGEDGGPPLGTVAALVVARIAAPETTLEWIALARRLTVRELREKAREARDAAGDSGSGNGSAPSSADDSPAEDDLTTIRFGVPRAIGVAIDEARELHRAVCGGEATVAEFIEALLAESASGTVSRLVNEDWIGRRPRESEREARLEQKGEHWSFLRIRLQGEELCEARQTLTDVARVCEEVEAARGSSDAALRELIRLENEIELRLGDLLALMGESGAWRGLFFSGVGHYAEERLGMSRSVAEGRTRLSRFFRDHRALRGACEEGRLGLEAATLLARVLEDVGRQRVNGHESAWIDHAEESTLKRLREELRLVRRNRALHQVGCSGPIDDATWQRSRSRRPGQAKDALVLLTQAAIDAPSPYVDTVISLRLPLDLASQLLSVVSQERRRLNQICRDGGEEAVADESLATRAARLFSKRCGGVPEWCALFSLIEEFIETWDDPRQSPKRAADKIYIRDGWRCSAPGCSSRRNLEEHHIVYRSQGGGEDSSNRVTLCRFHHQQGEHLGLMKCRGKAPLGITWLMGWNGVGGVFRNERKVRKGRSASEYRTLAGNDARSA